MRPPRTIDVTTVAKIVENIKTGIRRRTWGANYEFHKLRGKIGEGETACRRNRNICRTVVS